MKQLVRIVLFLGFGASAAAQPAAIPSRLTLEEALRLAEQRSPTLSAARALVMLAEADVVSAGRRPNPTLDFSSEGYGFGAGSRRPFFADQEIVLRVDQEIETAGRRRLRTDVATQTVEAARAALADEVRQLRLAVQRAYFQTVLARADRSAAQASLDEIDKVIEVSRVRYRLGELSGGELRRLEVERLRFADDVFAADLALRNARGALLALLGAGRFDQTARSGRTARRAGLRRTPRRGAGPIRLPATRRGGAHGTGAGRAAGPGHGSPGGGSGGGRGAPAAGSSNA